MKVRVKKTEMVEIEDDDIRALVLVYLKNNFINHREPANKIESAAMTIIIELEEYKMQNSNCKDS